MENIDNGEVQEDDDVVFLNYILPQDRIPLPEQIVVLDVEEEPEPLIQQQESRVEVQVNENSVNANNNLPNQLDLPIVEISSSDNRNSIVLHKNKSMKIVNSPETSSSSTASECSICFEHYVAQGDKRCVVTPCGHLFCYNCIAQVYKTGTRAKPSSCPKCRQVFKKNFLKLHLVFN